MKYGLRPLTLGVAALAGVWLIGGALVNRATAQGTAPAKGAETAGKTAGEFFKNVTTAPEKGLTVDDFLGTMGVISADLGLDCADCHPGAGSDRVDWVIDTDRKKMARKMIDMVAAINRTNFAGVQEVTCFTCHHGRLRPTTTIQLDKLYGPPNDETEDIVAADSQSPSATQILDKYIAAVGGAQKVNSLTSFVATGTSLGYEGLGGGGSFTIVAKAPDQRAVLISFKEHPERGTEARVFNGRAGWVRSPRSLLGEYDLTGGELNGQKLEAELAFPGQIKQVLTNMRVGPPDSIGAHDVNVVQGTGPGGVLATLYFDRKTGLLVRLVRYLRSPVGRIPTQSDYDDYRDVNGIKFPFLYTFSWLDGKDSFKLSNVQVNAAIDPSKFGKP
jgi:hypothetical protein